jgi:hypothetical protein
MLGLRIHIFLRMGGWMGTEASCEDSLCLSSS